MFYPAWGPVREIDEAGGMGPHPSEDRFCPPGDRFHPSGDRLRPLGDQFHPPGDRSCRPGDRLRPPKIFSVCVLYYASLRK